MQHKTITNESSMHYNQAAIGSFGLMPKTIELMDRRPNSVELVSESPKEERKVAKKYALKILRAARGCPLTASVLWEKGHNAKVSVKDLDTKRYKRFVKEFELISGYSIKEHPLILRYCEKEFAF